MPLPNTLDSFKPEIDLFKRALSDPKGVRVCYGQSREKAKQGQFRLQQARALDRLQTKRIYKPSDLQYGRSEYDILICRVREDDEGEWWVYIERHGMEIQAVEPLSEVGT